MVKKRVRIQTSAGMNPKMSEPPKKKPRKKPNPYRAPLPVKRYYKGIEYGIQLLRDDLLERIDDEEIKELIKTRAKYTVSASNKHLTTLEKRKTKQKMLEWEEKEWESL